MNLLFLNKIFILDFDLLDKSQDQHDMMAFKVT